MRPNTRKETQVIDSVLLAQLESLVISYVTSPLIRTVSAHQLIDCSLTC